MSFVPPLHLFRERSSEYYLQRGRPRKEETKKAQEANCITKSGEKSKEIALQKESGKGENLRSKTSDQNQK